MPMAADRSGCMCRADFGGLIGQGILHRQFGDDGLEGRLVRRGTLGRNKRAAIGYLIARVAVARRLAGLFASYARQRPQLLVDWEGDTAAEIDAMERLEHAAHTYFLARNLGEPIPLPPEELVRLRESGSR